MVSQVDDHPLRNRHTAFGNKRGTHEARAAHVFALGSFVGTVPGSADQGEESRRGARLEPKTVDRPDPSTSRLAQREVHGRMGGSKQMDARRQQFFP